jgi:sulfate transport system permease protein
MDHHLRGECGRQSVEEITAVASGTLKVRQQASGLVLRGAALVYLGLMVVLPVLALFVEAVRGGAAAFADALRDPFAAHALKLTFVTALVMVAINAISGTATAWVLVRYNFPGRGLVNALVDLPFAVPTIVTGVMLVVLFGPSSTIGTILGRYGWGVIYHQPGIVLALLFVTYPFVVRSVQPVLMEMDRAEEEAAATLGASAWTTFRRVTLPGLWPSILTGSALSFSRALGEFGSVVLVAGNQPLLTKTAPLYVFGEIESGNQHGALVVSAALLASSLLILIAVYAVQRPWGADHGR